MALEKVASSILGSISFCSGVHQVLRLLHLACMEVQQPNHASLSNNMFSKARLVDKFGKLRTLLAF